MSACISLAGKQLGRGSRRSSIFLVRFSLIRPIEAFLVVKACNEPGDHATGRENAPDDGFCLNLNSRGETIKAPGWRVYPALSGQKAVDKWSSEEENQFYRSESFMNST
jgi:hypothetical protein